ncbi:MAG: hypothetical protein ACK54I_02725 [Planctomycetota bacterium]|jgi:hypothetical protein
MDQKILTNRVALLTVFEDLPAAGHAVAALQAAGYPSRQIELVTYGVAEQSPELDMPLHSDSSVTSLVSEAEKGGLLGLEIAAVAGVMATMVTFPGVAIAMLIAGGLTGAIMGGIGGLETASLDDSVDLPTPADYEQLLLEGKKLVVVLGSHEEVSAAKGILSRLPSIQGHFHPISEHQFHEHPTKNTDS